MNKYTLDDEHFFNLEDVEAVETYVLEDDGENVKVYPFANYGIQVCLENGEKFHKEYKSHVERDYIADEIIEKSGINEWLEKRYGIKRYGI